jgi:hypothetical protein
MTQAVSRQEPSVIRAGEKISWIRCLSDYPADDGWTLSYVMINESSKETLTSTASGSDHLIEELSAVSADWAAGIYTLHGYVEKAGERTTVFEGSVKVLADLTQVATIDNRSHAKKTLDYLEAVIEGKAQKDQISYSIEGRSISRMSWADILVAFDKYKALYAAEKRAERIRRGQGVGNKILVRFK